MPRLARVGRLDRPLVRWIYSTARKHYWRVAHWYELEDLIQDGMLIYSKCHQRYAKVAANQQHFMALVQTAFMRHITTLARARKTREGKQSFVDVALPQIEQAAGVCYNDGPLACLIAEARGPIAAVFRGLTDGIVPWAEHETVHAYLSRLAGMPETRRDIEVLFRSFLRGTGRYYVRQPT